ncbi:MAG TPA: dephospho-CoA kinase [Candidatus Limnocylindrales bacterium]|nr:dephospho-CoA kinase [Candidatus Limnocylindrales bacterium]
MSRALRIGITGPIGCGKSTVARWLGERLGIVVVDADHEARLVLAPGTPEVEAVYAQFGEVLRRSNGELDRPALGRIVFNDPAALRDLEAIVHPAVRPRILAAIDEAERDDARAVAIEAIKLVEGGLAELCDEVWLVTCDPSVQRVRLVGRGDAAGDADARITAQGDIADRLRAAATRVIDTSGSPEDTRTRVMDVLDEVLAARE